MNKDRIKGSAEQAKGKVKEVAGKATGDKKLQSEGKAQKVGGKIPEPWRLLGGPVCASLPNSSESIPEQCTTGVPSPSAGARIRQKSSRDRCLR
jgi:uncharacterized protein YjbJ (UPF0337 family)